MAELCFTDEDVASLGDGTVTLSVSSVHRLPTPQWTAHRQDFVSIELKGQDEDDWALFLASKEHVRQLAETFSRLYKNWDKT